MHADLRRLSVRSGAVGLSTQAIRLVLLVGSGMAMARLLTPSDFGLLAMVGVLIAIVESFRDFGFPMAAVQRENLTHEQLSVLFWTSLKLNLLTVVCVMLLAPVLSWFYGEERITAITLAMAAGLFVLSLANQHESLLMRQMRFNVLRTIEIGSMIGGIVVAIIAALMGAGYWALVFQFILTGVIRSSAIWLACGWRPAGQRRTGVHTEEVRSLLSYGADVTGSRIVTHIGRNLDRVLVGYFGGVTAIGLYDSAYRWSLTPFQQLFTPLMAVAVSGLSRVQHDPAAYRASCKAAFFPLFAVVIPVLAFMTTESRAVILFLLGDQWLAAVPLFQLLCTAAIATSMIKVTKWLYLSQGATRRQFIWALIFAPVMIVAVVIGTRWGVYGVAVGFTVGTWVLTYPSLMVCLAVSPLTMRDFLGIVGRPLLASIGAAVMLRVSNLLWPTSGSLLAELAAKLAVFSALYLLIWIAIPGGRRAAAEVLLLFHEMRKGVTRNENVVVPPEVVEPVRR